MHRLRARPRGDHRRSGAEGNLGDALWNAGKYDEAADLLANVLAVMKRTYGEDDGRTRTTAHMFAVAYREQGKVAKAEELLVWAVEASGRVDGKKHPETLLAAANLAATYQQQCKHAEAEELQVAVLEAPTRSSAPPTWQSHT